MIRSWPLHVLVGLWLFGCGNDLGYDLPVDGGAADARGDRPSLTGELPCDVQRVLSDRCQGCHGTKPANGAPISLVTYADLTATNDDGILIAERALARVKSAVAQMPPLPVAPATSTEIATLEAWVKAGAPPGECKAAPGPFDSPPVCTSGRMWTGGEHESPQMHPGGACITCHTRSDDDDAPQLRIGGTVYPTGHEPNDCYGATSATVEVTDATGSVTMLPVNASGNFLTSLPLAFPIHVAVVANGKRRSMGASPPTGDCNRCHTQSGANGAPGRIALP